jgi:hypothetical protein
VDAKAADRLAGLAYFASAVKKDRLSVDVHR